MKIRKLEFTDYEQYHILINNFRNTKFTKEEFINILNEINLSKSDIWVIEINNELIATATILYENKFIYNICKFAHVEDVCVKKEYRGKGYGKIIMKKLIEESVKNGCYKITLNCADENIKFYESCGLTRRGNQMSELISNISAKSD